MKTYKEEANGDIWTTSKYYCGASHMCTCVALVELRKRGLRPNSVGLKAWVSCPDCLGIGTPPIPCSELPNFYHEPYEKAPGVDFDNVYAHPYLMALKRRVT